MRYLLLIASLFFASCGENTPPQDNPKLPESELVQEEKANEGPVDTPNRNVNANPEQLIADIRLEYQRINSLSLVTKKYPFVCDVDGVITYYTDKGKVVKIAIDWGFVGDGSSTSEYYYKGDKLFFIYETVTGGPANGPITKTEYRTYVNADTTIRYMENQKITHCTTCQFNASSREYKALKAFGTKDFKAALCD